MTEEFDDNYSRARFHSALDNAIRLAPAARAAGIPVIFTEVKYGRTGDHLEKRRDTPALLLSHSATETRKKTSTPLYPNHVCPIRTF
ncbi:isochorismatase family protein [Granulosicoccus antarcticus]|uniref:Uncharacterized protein n=1 Tax=Granulosicoccus antarcticus IMCC3135 TaxID=1192854 RepID=A0A2Z2P0Z6_9GAMM|nr:isochorismatase family protein [Granulosicoccus antarcticus]ASJ73214.1 hypothetical protein IMCC3135_15660 [Granulosicoccus antarcticus IMCC3135]